MFETNNLGITETINNMNKRRGGRSNLSEIQIYKRVLDDGENGPGIRTKFYNEYNRSGQQLTPRLALEMASITYYANQPNCPGRIKILYGDCLDLLHIPRELAEDFCRVKYDVRSTQFSSKNKLAELFAMERFFQEKNLFLK